MIGEDIHESFNDWSDLRNRILDCDMKKCSRHHKPGCKRISVLFDREGIRQEKKVMVLISQDPAVELRKEIDDAEKIEEKLVEDCQRNDFGDKPISPYPNGRLKEMLQRIFNPRKDPIYWTHSLKCLPKERNPEIGSDWPTAGQYCTNYLRNELLLLAKEEIVIIAFGRYAINASLSVLGKQQIPPEQRLLDYLTVIRDTTKSDWDTLTFHWENRTVRLYVFPHPRWESLWGAKKIRKAGLERFLRTEGDKVNEEWSRICHQT